MDKFIAHILVVDDDDGIRSLIKKFLNENKFLNDLGYVKYDEYNEDDFYMKE